eukprot:CAMPEP_0173384152 /NCGR_PEP_ID=MMETSP1356-20130122/6722_1 /TAXON_ID=77927 ORGANISM="Hemiselmis virescens, Strain PCC157" /NCGR_SAMPLE_ID=MMETSP1356 /ASSEMBLY_ACC=CAM_ASM_000847 /LENGTH=39 /DNA_ID= /DNA_START= /DNA_END= /DNA_ORIENTATION=
MPLQQLPWHRRAGRGWAQPVQPALGAGGAPYVFSSGGYP